MAEKTIFLDEAKKITGSDKPLTFAYTKNGMDFYVSDVFHDKERHCPVSLLCVVKRIADELILRLPYVTIDKNKGFSTSEAYAIQDMIWSNQHENALKYSPDFMRRYGLKASKNRKGIEL